MSKTLIRAWLIVGTLDILAAFASFYLQTGKNPVIILNFIASGIFGAEKAYSESIMPFIGLILHYFIAFVFTWIFFKIYPFVKNIITNKWVLGITFGLAIWCIMNLIILPMSSVKQAPFTLKSVIIGASVLIVCIGLPLSFIASSKKW